MGAAEESPTQYARRKMKENALLPRHPWPHWPASNAAPDQGDWIGPGVVGLVLGCLLVAILVNT